MLLPATVIALTAGAPSPPMFPTPDRFEEGAITIDTPGGSRTYPYRLLRPDVPEGVTLPLLVFMHGAGERGDDNTAQLKHFPERWLRSPHLNRHDAFILAVQCPRDTAWTDWNWTWDDTAKEPPLTDAMRAVMAAIDDTIKAHPIDENRLYLTGLSMGGYGSWELAARQPGRWAAVVPICGGGHPQFTPGLVGTPVWAWHGTHDDVVPESRSRVLVDALDEAGGEVLYTTLPGVGHGSWHVTYGPGGAMDWMFAQRRDQQTFTIDPSLQPIVDYFAAQGTIVSDDADPLQLQREWTPDEPAEVTIELPEVRDLTIPTTTGSVPARLYHPAATDAPDRIRPLLVWYHGGGWTWGNLESADHVCRFMALHGDVAVLSVDYRVAPQHRYPAAADDARDAARWAIANAAELHADPKRVAVGGDSAGGNLAAVTALDLRHDEQPPAAQYLVYPVTDTRFNLPSMRHFATGYLLEQRIMDWFTELYAPDHTQWNEWRIAPLQADSLAGTPPAIMMLPELDVLRDEGVAYASRLHEAGVPVELRIEPGMVHGFIGFGEFSPAARTATLESIKSLGRRLHAK